MLFLMHENVSLLNKSSLRTVMDEDSVVTFRKEVLLVVRHWPKVPTMVESGCTRSAIRNWTEGARGQEQDFDPGTLQQPYTIAIQNYLQKQW